MPPTMCQATISLLPKPGKDHSEMNNFRPISMLNNVYKLFAKILAMRMETAAFPHWQILIKQELLKVDLLPTIWEDSSR